MSSLGSNLAELQDMIEVDDLDVKDFFAALCPGCGSVSPHHPNPPWERMVDIERWAWNKQRIEIWDTELEPGFEYYGDGSDL